ncbi:hypothetical protein HJFPF1_13430 [Paramyrothecium foliicola]|nr:hypothetical protein HJFPF1_13430 [Paramyrothecium foliicola]
MTVGSQKIINLQQGCPTPRLVPTEAIAEASQSLLTRPDIAQRLMYGPDGGEDYVRANIAGWLTGFYHPEAGSITPDRIAITNGASNALSTILQICTDPSYTRAIWIIEPTYFLARKIWLDAGFGDKMCAVPDSGSGIDVALWRQGLEETERKHASQKITSVKTSVTDFPKIYKHVLYLVPTNSNPIGHTLSYDTRLKIVELAREFDVLVIADDVYDFLRWPKEEHSPPCALEPPTPRLVDIDRSLEGGSAFGNAISNGSFSKIVAPGMRVGWVEGTPAFIKNVETVGGTQSGGCQSQFTSMIIDAMLSSGQIMSHLEKVLIPTFWKRYYSMVRAIREHLFPLGVQILHGDSSVISDKPTRVAQAGGYFLYIVFPEDDTFPSVSAITKVAREKYFLQLAPGDIYQVNSQAPNAKTQEAFRQGSSELCNDGLSDDSIASQKPPRSRTACLVAAKQNSSHTIHLTRPDAASSPSSNISISQPSTPEIRHTELAMFRPTPFPDIKSTPHRFYLHHFIQQTAAIYFPLQPDAFLGLVMPVAENSRCMLGAMLAASSSHYFRLNNSHQAHVAAIESTVNSLSSLRQALNTAGTGSEMLATSLMLATTCLCAGDTSTYRQHLDGALKTVEKTNTRHNPDPLWSMSLRWLTQLLLMDRLSSLHLPTQQRLGAVTWQKLLASMPNLGQIDRTTGLSAELISALRDVCDLSDVEIECLGEAPSLDAELESTTFPSVANGFHVRSLESFLLSLRDAAFCESLLSSHAPTDVECSHNLFINATLLCLYKRLHGFSKDNPAVAITIDIMISWFQRIDEDSCVNAPLLWPLLAAGCEATTDNQRVFFAERMASMASHGLGNCRIVLGFLKRYWQEGCDMRWDIFAKHIEADLILF